MQMHETLCIHMSKYFGQKTRFFWTRILRDHYALVFTRLLHKLILLFLRFEFAQESKKLWESDIDDVQNRHRRKTFGKIDALLGVLRNFLGTQYSAWYMQWEFWTVNYFHFYQAGHMSKWMTLLMGVHWTSYLHIFM